MCIITKNSEGKTALCFVRHHLRQKYTEKRVTLTSDDKYSLWNYFLFL